MTMTSSAKTLSGTTGGSLPIADQVSKALARVEAIVGSDKSESGSTEPALATILRAIAQHLGAQYKPAAPQQQGEDFGAALQRSARASNLLMRDVDLSGDWSQQSSAPLVVLHKETQTPAVLLPTARGWRLIDPSVSARPQAWSDVTAAAFGTKGFIVVPALPDKKLTSRELLSYGLKVATPDLAAFGLMTAATGLLAAAAPLVSQTVTDTVIPGRESALLANIVGLLIVLFFANLATRLASALAQLRIDGRIGSMLRFAAAERAVRIAATGHSSAPPPIMSMATRAVSTWHRSIWHLVLSLVAALFVALPSLAVIARAAPIAALIVLACLGLAGGLAFLISRRQVGVLLNGAHSPVSWMATAFESLSQLETIRAVAAEKRIFINWIDGFMPSREKMLHSTQIGTAAKALEAGLNGVILTIALVSIFIFHRQSNPGEIVAFSMAIMTVTGAATALVGAFSQAAMLGLQRRLMTPLMERAPALSGNGRIIDELAGHIEVNSISVRHNANSQLVLQDVSLKAAPGEHIGIAGPSGSGKSTLLQSLLGFKELETGAIFIDGVALSEIDGSSLRRKFGCVGQSGKLFPGTILDNIATGAAITTEMAWHALERAALADDIRAMPLGLGTPISDADPSLSGGQIQRIMVARALVHNPKLVILDEATSALDPKAQAIVSASLDELRATVITVAHRLETLARCDRIYVLEAGRIVESGTFKELDEAGGLFAGLVASERDAATPKEPAHNDARDLLQKLSRSLNEF